MSPRQSASWAGEPVDALRERWNREAVHTYGKVDSTNAVARRLAEEDAPAGTVVLAREQSRGRGRGDRSWHSPPGAGLYLSMIFRPGRGSLAPLASILAGLGVAVELDRAYPALTPRLKWPNDVIAGSGKLGGLLAEAAASSSGPRFLVVGVGINVTSAEEGADPDLRRRMVCIADFDDTANLLATADAAIRGLERWLHDPPASLDEATLDLVDRYDWLKGRRARLQVSDDAPPLPGVSTGIAPDGALLFRPDRGALRRVTAGSVLPDGD